ncbi:MAG: 50S ribosomal protein L17 [Acidobacteria bacterium]|nr:50S ribosomal protein L17 [Acidobacteriota bacterium]
MRHRWRGRKLGRKTASRMALLRGLSASLFDRERVRTTLPKAKELRSFAERLITISRRDDLHSRRRVLRHIPDPRIVRKLFDEIATRFADRPGGYTRILRLGPRQGDAAEMAILELLGSEDKITRRKRHQKKQKERAEKKAAGAEKAATA